MYKKFSGIIMVLTGIASLIMAVVFKEKHTVFFLALMLVGILVIIVGVHELYKIRKQSDPNDLYKGKTPPEYRRKKTLLSKTEMSMFEILKELVDERKHEVITQVALHSVIDKVTQTSYRNELFRICDFCIVDKFDYAPLLLIELNDSSHNRADRIERDKKVNDICQRAKMPLITIKTTEMNDVQYIKKLINKNILKG